MKQSKTYSAYQVWKDGLLLDEKGRPYEKYVTVCRKFKELEIEKRDGKYIIDDDTIQKFNYVNRDKKTLIYDM